MLKETRRTQILALIRKDSPVTVEELSRRFGVSYMTVWRDLKHLEEQGLIQRLRGGAVAHSHGQEEGEAALLWPEAHRDPHLEAKQSIGRYAAENLIAEGDTITIEAGTTASSLVPYLTRPSLTLLTNGLYTAYLAARQAHKLTLICSGGLLIETGAFTGPQAEDFFSRYRVKKAFLGAMGLTLEDGFTDPSPLYTRLKQAMRQNSDRVIMLIDSSKWGVRSLVHVMALEEVDVIVTDARAPEAVVEGLRRRGVEVHLAPVGSGPTG